MVRLCPGESITIYPYMYHDFEVEKGSGPVLIGEVSQCNDDNTDNRFYRGKRVLVVSHGALIGLTLKRLLPERYPITYIDNASLTILSYSEEKWDCILYNCTKHLV